MKAGIMHFVTLKFDRPVLGADLKSVLEQSRELLGPEATGKILDGISDPIPDQDYNGFTLMHLDATADMESAPPEELIDFAVRAISLLGHGTFA